MINMDAGNAKVRAAFRTMWRGLDFFDAIEILGRRYEQLLVVMARDARKDGMGLEFDQALLDLIFSYENDELFDRLEDELIADIHNNGGQEGSEDLTDEQIWAKVADDFDFYESFKPIGVYADRNRAFKQHIVDCIRHDLNEILRDESGKWDEE
jgi:hypothetical protein